MRKKTYKRQGADVKLKVQKSAVKGLVIRVSEKISIYKRIREKFVKKEIFP